MYHMQSMVTWAANTSVYISCLRPYEMGRRLYIDSVYNNVPYISCLLNGENIVFLSISNMITFISNLRYYEMVAIEHSVMKRNASNQML